MSLDNGFNLSGSRAMKMGGGVKLTKWFSFPLMELAGGLGNLGNFESWLKMGCKLSAGC